MVWKINNFSDKGLYFYSNRYNFSDKGPKGLYFNSKIYDFSDKVPCGPLSLKSYNFKIKLKKNPLWSLVAKIV